MNYRRLTAAPVAVLVAALALPLSLLADKPATKPAEPTTKPVAKFLRFNDTAGDEKLETSVVTYRNAAGQTVDLIGAVHIADKPYYDKLNARFKSYDALLYEMVKPEGAVMPAPGEKLKGGGGMIGGLQRGMQDILDLSYQLDEIDYSAANFVHADMSWEQFSKMQEDRGESFFRIFLRSALAQSKADGPKAPQLGLGELLVALKAPDKAKQLKLLVGRQFADAEQLTAALEGPKGSVILTERNKAAFEVLKQHVDAGDKKIGVFYGAAHLKGMEELLLPMGFTQVGEPQWLTAWTIGALPTPATKPAGK